MNYKYENKSFVLEKLEEDDFIKIIQYENGEIKNLIKLNEEKSIDLMKGLECMISKFKGGK